MCHLSRGIPVPVSRIFPAAGNIAGNNTTRVAPDTDFAGYLDNLKTGYRISGVAGYQYWIMWIYG